MGASLVAALVVSAAAAGAQDEPDPAAEVEIELPDETFPLEIGPWLAIGAAGGTATATEQGITVTWVGNIPAQFRFVVGDDGSATGEWQHFGDGEQTIAGNVSGFSIEATGTFALSGGGAVGGTNEELELTGSSTVDGVLAITVGGATSRGPYSNTSALPRIAMEVKATSCDEAYGEWAYTVEQEFEGQGFDATFDGFWSAIRETDVVSQNASELFQAAGVDPAAGDAPDLLSQSPLLGMSAALLREYNAFVDSYPGWTIDQVLDIAGRAENLLGTLRNLTPCDLRLFGEDNIEDFITGLTFVLQNLVIGAAGVEPSSMDFQNLVHLAVRNGLLGPGASNPAAAVDAETALIRAGEAILEANVDPADGLIRVNDDTTRVMATGAAMGWDFTVAGRTYDARETYEYNFGDDSWTDEAPAEAETE